MYKNTKIDNSDQKHAYSTRISDSKGITKGAHVYSITIRDGVIACYKYDAELECQTIFKPNNGAEPIVLNGVCCDYGNMLGYPYQLNGIKVGKAPSSSFTVGMLIHEFGHHLQQQKLGTFRFLLYAGIGSAIANIYQRFGGNYYSIYSEKDASIRGQAYIDKHYPTCEYLAVGL